VRTLLFFLPRLWFVTDDPAEDVCEAEGFALGVYLVPKADSEALEGFFVFYTCGFQLFNDFLLHGTGLFNGLFDIFAGDGDFAG